MLAPASLPLESLPVRRPATITTIAWDRLAAPEARRLREFGFEVGVHVEILHRAALFRGPVACRIGRMTVALRRNVAAAITVMAD
ncbi:FeoA family protein [Sphingomonas jeddahensis]|uniref:FeoA domain protein n=1 Tax=Sphingomonas jeddahensis TaxID=1915074 RepID=A0A1V2EXM8_9SPHN|nr:FeoA family protein [Sphingomonas jeddahensis]ONF96949.1 FeoA domain protein [Sphingomonas jeddahensis]